MTDAALRTILHVDMDAFYASVETRDHPVLEGQAVIVGGLGPRGVVATANYAARAFGVHSAMPMKQAQRLCPQAHCLHPRMERYRSVSAAVFECFRAITPLVEGVSVDEAFLDVTASLKLFGSPLDIAQQLKSNIRTVTGLTASVGVAHNKFLAKLASDLQKPDGLVCVPSNSVHEFLDPIPISRLWGIGPRTAPRLKALGILTFGSLRRADIHILETVLGNRCAHFQRLASGEDDRAVEPVSPDKSISHEVTFDQDLLARVELLAELLALSEAVAFRLRQKQLIAGTVVIKVRDSTFHTITRSRSMRAGSNSTMTLYRMARALFESWRASNRGTPVRLLGVGVSNLEHQFGAVPGAVQEAGKQADQRSARQLDQVFDSINSRYGAGKIAHGLTLRRKRNAPR